MSLVMHKIKQVKTSLELVNKIGKSQTDKTSYLVTKRKVTKNMREYRQKRCVILTKKQYYFTTFSKYSFLGLKLFQKKKYTRKCYLFKIGISVPFIVLPSGLLSICNIKICIISLTQI